MLKFTCSNCNHKIAAPEKYAGKRVRCPKCKAPMQVPESAEKTIPEKSDLIKFRCPNCNQKIALTPNYAGKRVRCAKCKNSLLVPPSHGQPEHSRVKDETEVLKAGHEKSLPEQDIWGDMPGMDELLSAEESAPAAERQVQPGPADFTVDEGEPPAFTKSGLLAESRPKEIQPKKKRSTLLIVGACVLGLLLLGTIVLFSRSDSETDGTENEVELNEVKDFAENYIALLQDGDIDRAMELLSPDLQSSVKLEEIEQFAEQLSKDKILGFDCGPTHFEENPAGNRFYLWYNIRYENNLQFVILSMLDVNGEWRVDGVAAQNPAGGVVSIGPSSFEELSNIVLAAAAKKYVPIFTKYFCGFMLVALVLGLVQVVSMWTIFDKAGQPGWAAIVPFYNMWVLAEVGDKPGWLGLLTCFAGVVPFVGSIIQLVLWLIISIGVAKAFGRGVAFGIGLFLVPFVFYPILAFASD